MTKTGSGIVTLTGANTYTGGTHINGGFLVIAGTAANGDAVLGATGTGNDLSFNGGTLFTNVTGGLTTARNITLGANGGTIEPDTAFTTSGVVSGTGPLLGQRLRRGRGDPDQHHHGHQHLHGRDEHLPVHGRLRSSLSGNGSIASSGSYDLSGNCVTLDNSGTTGVNRLSDTGAIAARGDVSSPPDRATARPPRRKPSARSRWPTAFRRSTSPLARRGRP